MPRHLGREGGREGERQDEHMKLRTSAVFPPFLLSPSLPPSFPLSVFISLVDAIPDRQDTLEHFLQSGRALDVVAGRFDGLGKGGREGG